MFDRYEIQSKLTEETCSVGENEHCEGAFVDNVNVEEDAKEVSTNNDKTSPATEELPEQPLNVPTRQQQQEQQRQREEPRSLCTKVVTCLQYTSSLLMLLFSIVLVVASIVTKQTAVAESTHPIVALVLLVGLLLWLGVLEGGQGCIVGLQPRDPQHYANSHVWTFRCTKATAGKEFGTVYCGSSISGRFGGLWH